MPCLGAAGVEAPHAGCVGRSMCREVLLAAVGAAPGHMQSPRGAGPLHLPTELEELGGEVKLPAPPSRVCRWVLIRQF